MLFYWDKAEDEEEIKGEKYSRSEKNNVQKAIRKAEDWKKKKEHLLAGPGQVCDRELPLFLRWFIYSKDKFSPINWLDDSEKWTYLCWTGMIAQ